MPPPPFPSHPFLIPANFFFSSFSAAEGRNAPGRASGREPLFYGTIHVSDHGEQAALSHGAEGKESYSDK
jgi:hypothetical protein